MTDMNKMNEEIDAEELMQVEGGYYSPCGCIPFPFPECPPPEEPIYL